jgi:hypothetical protein
MPNVSALTHRLLEKAGIQGVERLLEAWGYDITGLSNADMIDLATSILDDEPFDDDLEELNFAD